jgi:putative hydrolase of the HAD superfamily
MVEDSLANLRTAKRLGMTTVWVTRAARVPAFVDLAVRSLLELPRRAAQLA